MYIDFEQLIDKLKEFMMLYDEKEITVADLRENFDYKEIATIVANQTFNNKYAKYC